MERVRHKPPKHPKHAALWEATPRCDRYRIDNERYIYIAGRGLVKLESINPETIDPETIGTVFSLNKASA